MTAEGWALSSSSRGEALEYAVRSLMSNDVVNAVCNTAEIAQTLQMCIGRNIGLQAPTSIQ